MEKYESLREGNIERNRQFLREIGLFDEKKKYKEKSSAGAKRRREESTGESVVLRRSARVALASSSFRVRYKEEDIYNEEKRNDRRNGYDVNNRRKYEDKDNDFEDKYEQSEWSDRETTIEQSPAQDSDPSKSSGCDMNTDIFFEKLGEPLEVFGKAHVMTLANKGQLPRFSKYSGVANWRNGYFLWVNIDVDPKSGKNQSEYPNVFLDGGKRITWFGGGRMHPQSSLVQGLLHAGKNVGREDKSDERDPPQQVFMFVREVKLPYSCFGRVIVDEVDLKRKPICITWKFVDYDQLVKKSENFRRISQSS